MSLKPALLFRSDRSTQDELLVSREHFSLVTDSRVGIQNSLVIGRYSVLPFYAELEKDLKLQGSRLINSHFDHTYIANFDYYYDIEKLTAKTWFDLKDVPDEAFPIVVKGRTNSRKFDWATLMFAKDKRAASLIAHELSKDSLIGNQGLVFRKYLPLKVLEYGISGTPFCNEWRCFFYKDELLSYGFYWTNSEFRAGITDAGLKVAKQAASILKDRVAFFVVDIAEDVDGNWWVIEVNDGQMSGLSDNDPQTLYRHLAEAIAREDK
jgi:hypothetical protein